MDSLDVRILRVLFQGPPSAPLSSRFRESLVSLSSRVGADEATVRHRLRKIEDSGFIAAWRLMVNPRLWGGGQLRVDIDVDPTSPKRDLVEELKLVPGALFVAASYDALSVVLEVDHERSVPRVVELLRRLAGAPVVFVAAIAFPDCRAILAPREWDLVRALRWNPWKSYAALASEAGLSRRTARVRLTRLTAQGLIFAWPSLNLRAVHGGVFVHLVTWCPGKCQREIDESITAHLEPYLWHASHLMPYRPGELWPCGYNLFVPNASMARETLTWAEELPGVARARLYLYEDIFSFLDTYDEEFDRRLGRMPSALPTVRLNGRPRATARAERPVRIWGR